MQIVMFGIFQYCSSTSCLTIILTSKLDSMHNILAKNIGWYVVIVQCAVCMFCLVVHGLNVNKLLLRLKHHLLQYNSKILLPLLTRQLENIKKTWHLKLWQKVAPLPQCLKLWKSRLKIWFQDSLSLLRWRIQHLDPNSYRRNTSIT